MSRRQVPPSSPLDEEFQDETLPLASRKRTDGSGGGGAGRKIAPAAAQARAFLQDVAREIRTPETKESYKSSEFLVLLAGILGVLLSSAVSAEFAASGAWMAITILSIGYMLSRGFAKAGTGGGGPPTGYQIAEPSTAPPTPKVAAATGATGRSGEVADQLFTPETKVSYKSTEFILWGLGVVGILLAAQASVEFDAPGAWRLIAYLSSGYILSRGLAKAASHRGYNDPNYGLPPDLSGRAAARSLEAERITRQHISTPETKEFFKTSEFLVLLITVFGIAIASNVDLFLDASTAWTLMTIVAAAYMVSRGLAKLGSVNPHRPEPPNPPR